MGIAVRVVEKESLVARTLVLPTLVLPLEATGGMDNHAHEFELPLD